MISPLADLVGVDAEIRSDLADRLLSLNGFQNVLGLERSVVGLSLTKYNTIPPVEIRWA